ncbi:hypothetical protein IF2G_05687 [Cordyceps javanica]|nr:hypothetical protein IF2G_05687 [Cordyceps javanica]
MHSLGRYDTDYTRQRQCGITCFPFGKHRVVISGLVWTEVDGNTTVFPALVIITCMHLGIEHTADTGSATQPGSGLRCQKRHFDFAALKMRGLGIRMQPQSRCGVRRAKARRA